MTTHGKRARELAQQERRERKRAKKAEVAAQRSADKTTGDNKDAHVASAESIR